MNLILLGVISLAIFVYLVLLIRKRWKQNFLHPPEFDKSIRRDDPPKS
jgi:hypothetical protein